MRRVLPVLALLTVLGGLAPRPAAAEVTVTPLLDLRVRQEILDGVYHFTAPDPDRNWLRVRTRGGGRLDAGAHRFEVRLANEHRHYILPDQSFDWDELIVDRAFYAWQVDPATRLTFGRQDIIWPGGLLMLEGHPYDGSRSIYQNAVRLEATPGLGKLDLALIHNPKRDGIVLAGDDDRRLTDADENGVALRLAGERWAGALIYKREDDPDEVLPDLTTVTGSLRHESGLGETGRWHAELALQYQDGDVRVATAPEPITGGGWALAGEAFLQDDIGAGWTLEGGGFYYSGGDGDLRPFRTPWGRWPRWSELYIYTLIGESTPGRVDVAAWENIAAPRLTATRPLDDRFTLRLNANYLLAPSTSWEARGLLTEVELKATLGHGLTGHLLWEMLDPGAFHDGRHGLPPLTETVHFLRWQVAWSL